MDNRSVLAVFDFDHTICEDNTDVVVRKLLPEERIPQSVKDLYRTQGWIPYMSRIFELLHENGIGARRIKSAILGIPPVPGMEELLRALHANGHEVIIISDSNSVFINCWLKHRQLEQFVTRVFTNPARYDAEGRLRVDGYHTQRRCELSAVNLCKGQVLTDYKRLRWDQGRLFSKIVYVGDGKNDLCPVLRLSSVSFACPRKSYALIEALKNLPGDAAPKAKILPWENGRDLKYNLQQIIELR